MFDKFIAQLADPLGRRSFLSRTIKAAGALAFSMIGLGEACSEPGPVPYKCCTLCQNSTPGCHACCAWSWPCCYAVEHNAYSCM